METTDKQQQLSSLIEKKLSGLSLPEKPASLYEPVRYTLALGGKRVRPYFTIMSCGMCGGDPDEAIPAALAIELLHNFTLLHDDIMDQAHTRRGKPSVFKQWDASTAILSGDAMYARAFEQLQYYGRDQRYSKKQYALIMDIFLESARIVCEGQAYDLEFEGKSPVTINEYLYMIKGKTAALISGAFKLGGSVAGISESDMEVLEKIGTEVGIAFQIQDDLLDATADPEKFGKIQGGDIKKGKKTYLSILSLQYGNEDQKAFLDKIFSQEEVFKEDITRVIELYHSLGVIEETKGVIKKRYKSAVKYIDTLNASIYKADLVEFLNKLINREY